MVAESGRLGSVGHLGGNILSKTIDFSDWIPIFPLPNAVLMPRAILPLHVFEQRYREMTRAALVGPRLIAMALLKPGYETGYNTHDVAIYPEVCVGRILREEELPDGRFNFLLQGVARARVIAECGKLAYRRGRMEVICPVSAHPEIEYARRKELRHLLREPPLLDLATGANWLELFNCPDFTFSDIVDVLASVVLPSPEHKHRFLAEPRVAARATCLCETLRAIAAELQRRSGRSNQPRHWPPTICNN